MSARTETISKGLDVPVRVELPVRRVRRSRYSETSTKLEFVEGMRAVAALYVVISHICSMIDPNRFGVKGKSDVAPWLQTLMTPFWHGHLAVAAFIVISGFCLQFGLYQRGDGRVYGLGKFFKRRAMRILPAYYAALIVSILVCIYVTTPNGNILPFSQYIPLTTGNIVSHIFLVHNWSAEWMFKINGALWSIGIEAQLYVLFPWLILIMQKRSPLALIAAVGIPAGAVIALFPNAGKMYSWFALLFVAGMLAAHFAYRPNLKFGGRTATPITLSVLGVLITGGIIAFNLSAGKLFDASTLIISDLAFGIATAAFLYFATIAPGSWLEQVFSLRPIVKLGIFSYSLYLLHHPLMQVFYAYRPTVIDTPEVSFMWMLGVGVPSIIAISWVFSFLFERPFVKSYIPRIRAIKDPSLAYSLPIRTVASVAYQPFEENFAYMAGPSAASSSLGASTNERALSTKKAKSARKGKAKLL